MFILTDTEAKIKILYGKTGDNMAMDWVENKNVENTQGPCKIVHCKDCAYYPRYKGLRPSEWLWPGVTDATGGCPCKTNHFSSSWIPDDDWFCANGVGFKKDE